jgi:GGDEF domain-containing protein
MKKNWLIKLDYRIPLEVMVGATLALYLIQQIGFYELLSEKVFIVSTLLTFLGLILGLLSTSLMLLVMNLILISTGAFLLYFDPVIMITKIKLLLIFVIPMYSVIAFFIKRTLYVRKLILFREEDIHSYLKFRDPLTGYRTIDSFFSKYPEFIESLSNTNQESSRLVVVSLFYVDFYIQYFDRNQKAADQMVREMAERLLQTRNPEELFFYLKNGAFIVLSTIYDNEIERIKFEKRNELTKSSLSEIVFTTEQVQNITIRKSDCYISRKTTYTADQVLDYLYRRSETDLAIEYI